MSLEGFKEEGGRAVFKVSVGCGLAERRRYQAEVRNKETGMV